MMISLCKWNSRMCKTIGTRLRNIMSNNNISVQATTHRALLAGDRFCFDLARCHGRVIGMALSIGEYNIDYCEPRDVILEHPSNKNN